MKTVEIKDLYTAGGFLNLPAVLQLGYKYTIIISMRGGGKTYGALKYFTDTGEKFIYFRRTLKSLRMCCSPDFHVLRPLEQDTGKHFTARFDNSLEIGYFYEEEKTAGYAVNLSTFAAIRSIGSASALGVSWLCFDEFIPQPDEVKRYDLFEAWRHAEETLIRNDAIHGTEPRRLLMANADTIRGDIVRGYRIDDAFMEMQESGIEAAEFTPDMLLLRPGCEELAALKSRTSLYRVSDDNDVMLHNRFTIEDRPKVGRKSITEYKAVCTIGGICIYRHKSRAEYYISETVSGKPKIYRNEPADLRRYIRENTNVWRAYLRNKVYYETLHAQTLFLRLYDL